MVTREEILENRIKSIKRYPYGKYVYRLQTEKQVKSLFNNPEEIEIRTNVYYGMIGRIEAAVYFCIGSNPSIHAKTKEELYKINKIYEMKFTALK